MANDFAIIVLRAPDSNTTQDFTESGFGTGQFVDISYGNDNGVEDSFNNKLCNGRGWYDGTTYASVCHAAEDGTASTDGNLQQSRRTDQYILEYYSNGSNRRQATASFITDGVRLTWTGTTSRRPWVVMTIWKNLDFAEVQWILASGVDGTFEDWTINGGNGRADLVMALTNRGGSSDEIQLESQGSYVTGFATYQQGEIKNSMIGCYRRSGVAAMENSMRIYGTDFYTDNRVGLAGRWQTGGSASDSLAVTTMHENGKFSTQVDNTSMGLQMVALTAIKFQGVDTPSLLQNGKAEATATSVSTSPTLEAGKRRKLVVFSIVAETSGQTASTATYDGNTMQEIDQKLQTDTEITAFYYDLPDNDTGSKTIQVNVSASAATQLFWGIWDNANEGEPEGLASYVSATDNSNGLSVTNATSHGTAISCAAGELSGSWTHGTGQIELEDNDYTRSATWSHEDVTAAAANTQTDTNSGGTGTFVQIGFCIPRAGARVHTLQYPQTSAQKKAFRVATTPFPPKYINLQTSKVDSNSIAETGAGSENEGFFIAGKPNADEHCISSFHQDAVSTANTGSRYSQYFFLNNRSAFSNEVWPGNGKLRWLSNGAMYAATDIRDDGNYFSIGWALEDDADTNDYITTLAHCSGEQNTSNTSSSYTQHTDGTFDRELSWQGLKDAGFAAGDEVIIFGDNRLGSASTNGTAGYKLSHGTTFGSATDFAQTEAVIEPDNSSSIAMHANFFVLKHTLVDGEDIYGATKGDGTNEGRSRGGWLRIMKLDQLDTADWVWDEDTHSGDAPSSWTTMSTLTLGVGNWVILGFERNDVKGVGTDFEQRLVIDGTNRSHVTIEGEDTAEFRLQGHMAYTEISSGTEVVNLQCQAATTTHWEPTHSALFALNTDTFADFIGGYPDPSTILPVTIGAVDTDYLLGEVTATPASELDYIPFCAGTFTPTANNKAVWFGTGINDTNYPFDLTTTAWQRNTDASAAKNIFAPSEQIGLGTVSADFQALGREDISASYDYDELMLGFLSAELNLVTSTTFDEAFSITSALTMDPVRTAELISSLNLTKDLSVSEVVSAVLGSFMTLQQNLTTVKLASAVLNVSQQMGSNFTVTEVVTAILNVSQQLNNDFTITEVVAMVANTVIPLTLDLDITEIVSVITQSLLGLQKDLSVTEIANIVTFVSANYALDVSMEDIATLVVNRVLSLNKTLTVSETVNAIFSSVVNLAKDMTLSQVTNLIANVSLLLNENISLTEIALLIKTSAMTFTKSINLVEAATFLVDIAMTLNKDLSIAQAASTFMALSIALEEDFVLAQSALAVFNPSILLTKDLNIEETATYITDVVMLLNKNSTIQETATFITAVSTVFTSNYTLVEVAELLSLVLASLEFTQELTVDYITQLVFNTGLAITSNYLTLEIVSAIYYVAQELNADFTVVELVNAIFDSSIAVQKNFGLEEYVSLVAVAAAEMNHNLTLFEAATMEAHAFATFTQNFDIAEIANYVTLLLLTIDHHFVLYDVASYITGVTTSFNIDFNIAQLVTAIFDTAISMDVDFSLVEIADVLTLVLAELALTQDFSLEEAVNAIYQVLLDNDINIEDLYNSTYAAFVSIQLAGNYTDAETSFKETLSYLLFNEDVLYTLGRHKIVSTTTEFSLNLEDTDEAVRAIDRALNMSLDSTVIPILTAVLTGDLVLDQNYTDSETVQKLVNAGLTLEQVMSVQILRGLLVQAGLEVSLAYTIDMDALSFIIVYTPDRRTFIIEFENRGFKIHGEVK